jgi:uncharacterized protein YegP (UPF0339 family)
MAATFVLRKSSDGQYYFNLRAGNHRIILTSERYTTKQAAQKGIDSVRRNASNDQYFQRKVSKRKNPYFVLTAAQGEPLGSSEEYSSATAARKGIAAVQRVAPKAEVIEFS